MSKRTAAAAAQILRRLKNVKDLEKNMLANALSEGDGKVQLFENIRPDEAEIVLDEETYKALKRQQEINQHISVAAKLMNETGVDSTGIESFIAKADEVMVETTAFEISGYLLSLVFSGSLDTPLQKYGGEFDILETKLRSDILIEINQLTVVLKFTALRREDPAAGNTED